MLCSVLQSAFRLPHCPPVLHPSGFSTRFFPPSSAIFQQRLLGPSQSAVLPPPPLCIYNTDSCVCPSFARCTPTSGSLGRFVITTSLCLPQPSAGGVLSLPFTYCRPTHQRMLRIGTPARTPDYRCKHQQLIRGDLLMHTSAARFPTTACRPPVLQRA